MELARALKIDRLLIQYVHFATDSLSSSSRGNPFQNEPKKTKVVYLPWDDEIRIGTPASYNSGNSTPDAPY
jgi:hypothetical protein